MYQPSPRASRIFVTGYVIKVCSTIFIDLYMYLYRRRIYWHAFRGYAAYHSSTLNGWWEGLGIHILKLFYHLHWSLLAMLISIYYCATFSLNVCLCYLCTQSVSYILFIALFPKFSPSTASDCIKVKSLGTSLCSTSVYIATVFSSPTKWLHKIKDR